jgi:SAM-dependent methyltransferase
LLALCGLLLVTAAAYISFGTLAPPGDEREPPPLERWWLRLADLGPSREPDVNFVPTPQAAVDRLLALAELKTNDVLYDLGCGDGRIVVTAAKRYGVRAIGVDIDALRVAESRRNARLNGVTNLTSFVHGDVFQVDFSDATVVTLYLLPELNVRLMPKLAKLKPGTRILSFDFDMRGAKPQLVLDFDVVHDPPYTNVIQRRIYKWTVPWQPE